MSKNKACLRAEAYEALEDIQARVEIAKNHALHGYGKDSTSAKLYAYYTDDSYEHSSLCKNHYLLAINALEQASLQFSIAIRLLGG